VCSGVLWALALEKSPAEAALGRAPAGDFGRTRWWDIEVVILFRAPAGMFGDVAAEIVETEEEGCHKAAEEGYRTAGAEERSYIRYSLFRDEQ